jgi:glycosyltransferase involved in cell wall biosynthesis
LVRELGLEERVRLLGQCQQMAAVYASVDIWVLPAKKPEGLGNVLIEAMAMGKPVVGSAIGGIPEIILDGQNGFLAPPGNAGALAAALRRLLRDPELRRRMGEAGRRRFLERFEFEACYRKILAAYHSVSGPGAAGVRARRAAGEPFPSSAQTP